MNKTPLTREGEKRLQEELKNLKLERPEISKAIAEAREQQGIVEAKIKNIEYKLANSEIIDNKFNKDGDQIIFGSIVELLNVEDNSKIKYQLVGEDEADLTKNKISFNSPIAQGLINKKIGDVITISVPKGELSFKVININ